MPSRADVRRGGEWALRVVLLATLAFALWRTLRARATESISRVVAAHELGGALREATRTPSVGTLDVTVDALPPAAERAWLAALRGAGVRVQWQGTPPAIGLTAERAREPRAPVRVSIVAGGLPADLPMVLVDSIGPIDTLRPAHGGATLEAADVVGTLRARAGLFAASVATPPATPRRAVLLLGRAGWESSFTAAALTESGWQVRARLPMAPGVAVTDAGLLPLDTSRYDVVVALDSTAADLAGAVARFVGQGGGLVAAGGATELAALRAIAPARASARRPGRILLDGDTLTRHDLPIRPLTAVRPDAVHLEGQPAGLATAVRRAGRGRVLAVGYDELWRWRMEGGASGEAAHRVWWSRMAGLVAPERDVDGARDEVANGAPVAALIDAIGPATPRAAGATTASSASHPLLLLLVIALALLAETASRRLRGAR